MADRTSELGRRIRAERERQGKTRRQVAIAADIAEQTVARIELYGSEPSFSIVVAIAAALGRSVDVFVVADGEAIEASAS